MEIKLYVDDLLISWSSESELKQIKDEFNHRFQMKYLGSVSELLPFKFIKTVLNLRCTFPKKLTLGRYLIA